MLHTRLLVGSLIIVLVCLAVVVDYAIGQPLISAAPVVVLAALGARELCVMARQSGKEPFRGLAVAGAMAYVAVACVPDGGGRAWGGTELSGLVTVILLGLTLIFQRLRGTLRGALVNCGMTFFASAYVGFLVAFLVRIRLIPHAGLAGMVFVVAVAKMGDMGAYFVGRTLGKRKLSPMVSPNKTVGGAVGGLAVSVGVGMIVCRVTGLFGLGAAAGVSALVGVLAQLGDLSESVLKRDLEAKDAGSSVPGFGGVLDLLDSLLFAAPAAYLALKAAAVL